MSQGLHSAGTSLTLDAFGEDARFEHVGMAVRRIEDGIQSVTDETQKVRVAFVLVNGLKTELVEPLGENSPVTRFLDNEQSLYHVCYRVPCLDSAIASARRHGFHAISTPTPAVAFEGSRIVWLYSKIYGLVELVEQEKSS